MRAVTTVTALLLDLANIVGGLLLAAALLRELPRVGPGLGRLTDALARAGLVIGVVALAVGGYYLIVHMTSGPHVFHFELVGLGVGVALLRDRLFPGSTAPGSRTAAPSPPTLPTTMGYPDTRLPPAAGAPGQAGPAGQAAPAGQAGAPGPAAPAGQAGPASGAALLLAVFGIIAIVVGIQGLLTPDG